MVILILSIFTVFADTSSNQNNLNDQSNLNGNNTGNETNQAEENPNLSVKAEPQPLAIIIFSFSATPNTLNLGTVQADNSETSFLGRTSISVTALGTTDLYVRASGNLVSSTDNIALSNFQYDGFNNATLTKRPFTTTDTRVRRWTGIFISDTVPVNYYLRVPTGTDPGTYSVTVYYTAV